MHVFLPPAPIQNPDNKYTVFLAGSIDMGQARHWQDTAIEKLRDFDIAILNPRREHWDSSISQLAEHPEFRAQVEWELNGLEKANLIVMYFDEHSKSPISFLELGLFAQRQKVMVYCPLGFWRKGNVDIVCDKYDIPHFDDEDRFFTAIQEHIKKETAV
jgi:hypothetical protein